MGEIKRKREQMEKRADQGEVGLLGKAEGYGVKRQKREGGWDPFD